MGNRTWIYHKTEEPQIIDSDDVETYHADGWRDSPAPFLDIKDFDIDPEDAVSIQQLGDTVQGICDSMNGALNIDTMTDLELEEYASEHFGKDINPTGRKRTKTLRKACKELVHGAVVN